MTQGWLYDGRSAVRRGARVEPDTGGIRLVSGSGEAVSVAAEQLNHCESRNGFEVYGHRTMHGWRLGVPAPVPEELAAVLPRAERYGRWIDRVGLIPALVIGAVISGAVLLAGNQAPEWLAPAVPRAWEERLGQTLVGDFAGKGCRAPEGNAALAALTQRIAPDARGLTIRVVDMPIVNAAALPGGNIVIFDQLLSEAKNADEVAGVLAHEVAHVEVRHVTESMIRALGFGVVISALGGTTGANVESLIAAGYSRDAEREADDRAIQALRRAEISPLPTAAFFARLGGSEGRARMLSKGLSYLSTHPISDERRAAFRASAVQGKSYRPALTDAQWKALRSICRPWTGADGEITVQGRR